MTPPVFCIAPWVNAYRGTDGFRSLCCISDERKTEHQSFESWWNSEEIRAARVTFLSGQVPEQCSACVSSNRTAGQGYNQWFNRNFGQHWQRIRDTTNAAGFTQMKPLALDHRTSHCNLRCRTCDARNSSSIRAESARHGDDMPPQASRAQAGEWHDAGMLDSIEHVYWAGGEPLMSPDHRPTMQHFLNGGRARSLTVHYTSNLMHLDDRLLADLVDYSHRFRGVSIGASIDGTGHIGAYVRTGWAETEFLRNVDLIRTHAPRIRLLFDCTLTSLGLLDLPQLLQAAAERGLQLNCKLMEVNGANNFLHVDLLQPDAVAAWLDRVSMPGLPAPQREVVQSVRELLERRYRPRPWTDTEAVTLQRSESRRGMPGFFMDRLGPYLNRAAEP